MTLFAFTRGQDGWDARLVVGPFEAAYKRGQQAHLGASVGPLSTDVTVWLDGGKPEIAEPRDG